jgi:uncharacterized protein (DUF3084 family)
MRAAGKDINLLARKQSELLTVDSIGSTRTDGESIGTTGLSYSQSLGEASDCALTGSMSALSGACYSQGPSLQAPGALSPNFAPQQLAQELLELQRRLRQREEEVYGLRHAAAELAALQQVMRQRDEEVASLKAQLSITRDELESKSSQLMERETELNWWRSRR